MSDDYPPAARLGRKGTQPGSACTVSSPCASAPGGQSAAADTHETPPPLLATTLVPVDSSRLDTAVIIRRLVLGLLIFPFAPPVSMSTRMAKEAAVGTGSNYCIHLVVVAVLVAVVVVAVLVVVEVVAPTR